MTNVELLREYKRVYGLTSQKVADVLEVSVRTVSSWLAKPESTNYRVLKDSQIKYLKLALRGRKKRV